MAKQNVNQVKLSDEDLAKIQKAVEDSRPKGYFESMRQEQISPKEAMEFVKENPEVLKLLVLKKGGKVTDENYDMLRGKIKEVKHHASELQSITNRKKQVPAWVLAKSTRASTDLSDITHYMDSQKFSGGGGVDGIEGVNSYLGLFKLNSNFRGDLVYWKKGEIVKAYESNKKGIIFILLADDNFQAYDEWEKSDFERIASPLLTNGGGIESTSHIQGEIDDIRNWDNDEIANYIGVPISYVARDRNRYVREAQNYMMLNTFETGGNIGFKELSSRVAKRYQGKAVAPKYQSQYGKRYSKSEAREVGDKVAGKVYWQQQGRKFSGGGRIEVVLDEGNGKVINDIYNMWNNVKTEQEYKKWVEKVKNTKFGTYGTISFEEVMENFNFDNAPINSFHLKTFKAELKDALSNTKFSGGGGVDDLKVGDKVVEYTKDSKFESGYFEGKTRGLILRMDGAMAQVDFGNTQIYWIPIKDLKKADKYSKGGNIISWDEVVFGDSARLVSENKMGIVIKPNGRTFLVLFPDGNQKTYDANELEFHRFPEEDWSSDEDYENGGNIKENRSGLSDLMYG